jgi:SAM-dependent methyltransferase
MKNRTIFKKYINTHNEMISKFGFTAQSLWGSKDSQTIRFNRLSNLIIDKSNFSVLDVGCGLCDFYNYLHDNNYSNFKYTGLEINDQFWIKAKEKYPNLDIRLGSLEEIKDNEKWDYAIASGIYNLAIDENEVLNTYLNDFKSLYDRLNIGFAVNFLSSFSDNKDSKSIYSNPYSIYKNTIEVFSKYIILDQTYLPNDFTILVYKNKNDRK